MSSPGASLRLFIGVYPPPEVASALVGALEGLDLPPCRVTNAEQVHLTLQFIGDTPVKELDGTKESVRRATAGVGSFALMPLRLITLPRRGPARLVATETDAPAPLLEMQRRLASRLARAPRRKPGDRFLPHLTLCRFRSPARMEEVECEVAFEPFPVERLMLMKSSLRPDGAVHEIVEAVELNR